MYNTSDIAEEIKLQRLTKLIWEETLAEKKPLGGPRMWWSDLRTVRISTDPTIKKDRT